MTGGRSGDRHRIVVVGGYGAVGRVVSLALADWHHGTVVVAGRDIIRARALTRRSPGPLAPMEVDAADAIGLTRALEGAGVLVMCADGANLDVARCCLERGVHYVDISASARVLGAIEALDPLARERGAAAALSVGLAPGLTNLLARSCVDRLGAVTSIDIAVLLGLGDRHGDAAVRWTLRALADTGGPTGARSARVEITGHGRHRVHPFPFSDQDTLRHRLGVPVTTRLCFDFRPLTGLVFAARAAGLLRPLRHPHVQDRVVDVLAHANIGSDRFAVAASARSTGGAQVTQATSGRGQSRATGLVAARVAQLLATGQAAPGVHHLDQLVRPADFLAQFTADQHGPPSIVN